MGSLLEQHWRSIANREPGAHVTAVLSNIDFIDLLGERLLQRMADAGVAFVVSGCMNRYVIEKRQSNGRAATGTRR